MSRKDQPRIDPSHLDKILLLRLRRMGDVIMTTPAVSALKEFYPQASLAYVIEEPFRRLVEGHPAIDQVISIPPGQKLPSFLRLLRKIRKEKYDVVIDFHGGPRASLIAFLSGAKLRIGYQLKYKGFIYDIRLPRSPKTGYLHSVENHINLVRAAGARIPSIPSLTLPPSREEDSEKVKTIWSKHQLDGARVVVLHIGAGNAFRDWGAEKLTSLSRRLAETPGVKVILIGSKEDKTRAEEIQLQSHVPLISMVGQLGLIELKEVLLRAVLFVGPDSGPMHVAAAAGTPIVAFFGPTLPAHFSPWKAKAILIEKELSCRPCKQRRCLSEDFRCLRMISAEEVFEACLSVLEGEKPSP